MARTEPKVSVVMTCYKYAHFLPFAVDSVLKQTYSNIELVMVNDGSPDDTDEVMQRYVSDPRVKYVRQENAGQTVAKNNGIKAATGEFIAFLDADDIWHSEKLSRQMPLFSDSKVGIVYSRMDFIDEAGAPTVFDVSPLSAPKAGKITEALFVDNVVPFSAAVVRRDCFDKVGLMDTSLKMAIDWDLWLRMSVHYEFAFVDEVLLSYRVGHSGQMSKNYFVREKDTMKIMTNFVKNNPNLLPRKLVNWVMAYSCCNRGYRFRSVDAKKSLSYYVQAIRWRWNHATAYYGILKLVGVRLLAPFGVKQ